MTIAELQAGVEHAFSKKYDVVFMPSYGIRVTARSHKNGVKRELSKLITWKELSESDGNVLEAYIKELEMQLG